MVTAPDDEPRLMTTHSKLSLTLAAPPRKPASVSVPVGKGQRNRRCLGRGDDARQQLGNGQGRVGGLGRGRGLDAGSRAADRAPATRAANTDVGDARVALEIELAHAGRAIGNRRLVGRRVGYRRAPARRLNAMSVPSSRRPGAPRGQSARLCRYEPLIWQPMRGSRFCAPNRQSQRWTWAPVEMSEPRQ
jgi:hypothetical protein